MTPDPLIERDRLWCQALIAEGTDVIQRVTRRFLALRDGVIDPRSSPKRPHQFTSKLELCDVCGYTESSTIHHLPSGPEGT